MLRFLLVPMVLSALSMVCGCASRAAATKPSTVPATVPSTVRVRVMTYNIHHGGGEDARVDLPRIAKVILAQNPDLVALQEVDMKTTRTGGVDQAAELGRLTGMSVRFGRAMDYQGGEYGQAILSRWPIEAVHVDALPGAPGAEPRIGVVATITGEGDRPTITFAGTHLDYQHEPFRIAQVRQLAEHLAAKSGLVVLVGDFNDVPGSAAMRVLTSAWVSATPDDALSHPAPWPTKKIDWILLNQSSGWRVIESHVVSERIASDHRPVVAELEAPSR